MTNPKDWNGHVPDTDTPAPADAAEEIRRMRELLNQWADSIIARLDMFLQMLGAEDGRPVHDADGSVDNNGLCTVTGCPNFGGESWPDCPPFGPRS